MFINNVTVDDDSLKGSLGSYECHAFAVGDPRALARHGFSVSVITSKSYILVYCSFYIIFNVFCQLYKHVHVDHSEKIPFVLCSINKKMS